MPGIFDVKTESGETMSENKRNYGKRNVKKRLEKIDSPGIRYAKRLSLSFFTTLLIGGLIAVLICIFMGFGIVKRIIDDAPEISLSSVQPTGFATRIYDSQGNLTETLVMSGANREEVEFEELPEDLIDAFVAMEDRRFWEHDGIDLRSIARAAVGVISGDYAGGGSTITQQLIKNNVPDGGRENNWSDRMVRKIQEQYLAVKLEATSGMSKEETKKEILVSYLNTINLGNNTLGVKTAADRYFGKEVSELNLAECTVLAAITSNPSRYNPISHPENNNSRRQVVLQYMEEQGYIDSAEREAAMGMEVYEEIARQDELQRQSSPYTYFTDALIVQVTDALVEELGYTESEAYTLLYSGGLEIYSTQDPQMQAIVDEELSDPENYAETWYGLEYRLSIRHPDDSLTHYSGSDLERWHKEQEGGKSFNGLYSSLEELNADVEAFKAQVLGEGDTIEGEKIDPVLEPQASFVLLDQRTGEVKALGGGRGEKTASLTLNRATDAARQPGSAFKVITAFAPALDTRQATLGSVYYDEPYTVNGHTFRNWWGTSRGYVGYANIRDGIIYSMNIIAVRALMETVTPETGIEYARNLGITTLTAEDVTASAALGGLTEGVTNLELTGAYAAIANGGVYTKPRFYTRILDREGNVILGEESETRQVLSSETAFLLTDAMSDSLEAHQLFARPGISINSTSTRARLSRMPAAGKSGTTTSNRDAWFVGFTDYYTAGIWTGYDENNKELANTSYHKSIWKQIMDRIHEELPVRDFSVPDSITQVSICRKSGKLAVSGLCDADPRGSTVYTEYFAAGTEPKEVCDVHIAASICTESGLLAGEFCPQTEQKVFMVVPEGSTSVTDDSLFQMPAPCTLHAAGAAGGDGQTENSGPSGADPGNSGPAGNLGGSSASGPGGGSDSSQGTIPSGPGDYLHEVRPVGPGYE